MNQSFQIPVGVAEVVITNELLRRSVPAPDYNQEKLALQNLAQQMADHPAEVLPRLVQLAMEMCDADSAGISILDGDLFRWNSLVGKLSVFEGTTTPRNFSPCGVCLDVTKPVLMARPERVYGWIGEANITIPEVLLVPLLFNGKHPLGTLWVVAKEGHQFHSGHFRVMSELSVFTGIALQMIRADQDLKDALAAQETLTEEMSHRVKNLFAITNGIIRMTAKHSTSTDELVTAVTGRLQALSDAHSLVRRSFAPDRVPGDVSLSDVIAAVLRPFTKPDIEGPPIQLGERSTNSVALVFHEFATNAAKYGALSHDAPIKVRWKISGEFVEISWLEAGEGVSAPTKTGFGSALVASTVSAQGGTIFYDWSGEGLAVLIALPLKHLES